MAKGDFSITLSERDVARMRRILADYETIDQNRAIKKGLDKGSKILVEEGKKNLSQRNKKKTGNLYRSMGKKLGKGYSLAGFRRPGGNHAHLVDRGTKIRYTKSGAYRGSVSKGNPEHGSGFFTDAVESKSEEVKEVVMQGIEEALKDGGKK